MVEPFTRINLADVPDAAGDFGFGEIQEARFATGHIQAQDTGVSYVRLKPNRRSPFGHRHEQAEEVYVVIRGSGRMKLDGEIVDLAPLDAVRVAPTVTRAFEAGSDGLEVLAFGAIHARDGEIVKDWWTD
jgi:mannose-6-phosphate isomerase-like protein (cupin superfamily)